MASCAARSAPSAPGKAGARATYARREPEKTVLHQVVSAHLESFLRFARDNYRRPLPRYVELELRRFVRCGVLRWGLSRLRCRRCGKDMLVAHSCKGRGICPSCGGRRMAATALHIVRKVLPDCPVRQWVLSVPFAVRRLLAADAKLFGAVVKLFARVVERFYIERARAEGIEGAKTGALSFQQRFGGSLNAHCHIHAAWVDGVFSLDATTNKPRFHFTAPPTRDEVQHVAAIVATRVGRMLRRKGLVHEPSHDSNETPTVDDALEACRNVGHGRGRFERIDARGRSQQELFPDQRQPVRRSKSALVGEVDGYSVEAGVHFGALDRKGREQLVRYCLRPAIANERLSVLKDGSIAYFCKYPTRGKSHRVMQPMELMARLAAIVPPPRFPLWRYHGVLAPGAPWRKDIVPAATEREEGGCSHTASANMPVPERKDNGPRKPSGDPSLLQAPHEPTAPSSSEPSWRPSTSYVPWAELLRHCFDIDVLECPRCHGRLEPIAVIRRYDVIARILQHLSMPAVPAGLAHPDTVAIDVTGEPLPDWVVGVDPLPPDAVERAPPNDWDCIDAPAPDG